MNEMSFFFIKENETLSKQVEIGYNEDTKDIKSSESLAEKALLLNNFSGSSSEFYQNRYFMSKTQNIIGIRYI